MALSDEDFNIEDEYYESSASVNNNNNKNASDDSNETTQSEIGSDETTQSESLSMNSDDNDEDDADDSNEEDEEQLLKKKQMDKAQRDLQNIHKKLRRIIQDKLAKKKKKKKTNSYRDKAKEADDEYLFECEQDMNESNERTIDVLSAQPSLINMEKGVMRYYQLDGLNWLIRVQETGLCAILADEMGLGKTLQCIALLAYNCQYKNIHGPTLIVVPKSTLYIWKKEFASWCPSFRIFLLDGDKQERKTLIQDYILSVLDEANLEFDIAITSYEQCNIESKYLKRISWFYIIVDEAHRMKNEKCVLSQTMRSFKSLHRLLMTGTPLQNNLHELWALLNFLVPDAFETEAAQCFDVLFEAMDTNQNEKQHESDAFMKLMNKMLSSMHKLLRPIMLRRLKYDVEKSLPPKTEMILYVGMSALQIALYKSLLCRNIAVLRDTISSKKALLNTAMQLRKVCNHPYLFDGVEDRSLPVHGQHLIDHSAKLCMLNKLLPKLREQGSKCLIFCQMTRMLDILDDYCYIRGYKRCRIDGNTQSHDRQQQMDDFNNVLNTDTFIFLLSTRAGGLGINLVAADCVIFYDSDWNPQMDLQAQDRAHRIGQTKPVKIFRLITENTIEERILQRAQMKLNLDEMVSKTSNPVSKDQVGAMIKYGIDAIVKLKDGDSTLREMNEMSIEEILAKGKEASSKLNELMAKHAKNKFSIKSTDYSLLSDCKLDSDVFRTLAKIKKQNKDPLNSNQNQNKTKKGGRTTNNSSAITDLKQHTIMQMNMNLNGLQQPPKTPNMQYFHFFNRKELSELFDKEWDWYNTYRNVSFDEIPQDNYERYGLTQDDVLLKEKLLAEGFNDWNHKHMWAFVKCCVEYGRENIDEICKALPMKSREEIIRYSKCFFENRYDEAEISKKIKDITGGERTLERYEKYDILLKRKVSLYTYPLEEMEFPYAPYDHRAHGWRIEHDRFIVTKANEFGYGDWTNLRLAVLNSKRFKFDYFIKSRTNNDINKRMRQLRPCIEREFGQHIRIFDRKRSAKEIQKRKLDEQNRLNNHLKDLSKALRKEKEKEKEETEYIEYVIKKENDNEPPKKKRKLNGEKQVGDELPTPPPVVPMVYAQPYIYASTANNDTNMVYYQQQYQMSYPQTQPDNYPQT